MQIAKLKLGKPTVTLKAKGKKLTVKYNKVVGAQKYEILIKIGKKWKKFDTNKLKLTKKLQKGKKYQVKVRAYVVENGVKVYGSYSTVKKIKLK